MSRTRAADDFATIRARMEELRRSSTDRVSDGKPESGGAVRPGADTAFEQRRQARIEGRPPPWVPTIFYEPRRI